MSLIRNKWFWAGALLVLAIIAGVIWKSKVRLLVQGFEKSPRGYYFRFTEGKQLEKVLSPGYHVIYQYLVLGPDGDTLENKNYPGLEQERPYPVKPGNEVDDALQIAALGTVVEILVPTDSIRKKAGNNLKVMNLPSGANARFVLFIRRILNPEEFEGYAQQKTMERIMAEDKQIDDFAAKTKFNWVLDSVKLIKYFIPNKTDKPRFKDGDEIEFNTEVYTLKGDLLISSGMEGRKYKIILGKFTYDLEAFDASMRFLSDGEEGTFLLTSDYGYGADGMGILVPPYTPLLVKLKDVKKIN